MANGNSKSVNLSTRGTMAVAAVAASLVVIGSLGHPVSAVGLAAALFYLIHKGHVTGSRRRSTRKNGKVLWVLGWSMVAAAPLLATNGWANPIIGLAIAASLATVLLMTRNV
jgi:hypothetical protein